MCAPASNIAAVAGFAIGVAHGIDETDARHMPRGVYGAPAREAALFAADTAAHGKGLGALVVKSWFELDLPNQEGGMVERLDIEDMPHARVLDMRRLKSRLRDEVALKLFRMLSPAQQVSYDQSSPNLLYDIAVDHDHLPLVLFEIYSQLQGVIHPLKLSYGLSEFEGQPPVPVLTMRDMSAHRLSEVLHHEDTIKVDA